LAAFGSPPKWMVAVPSEFFYAVTLSTEIALAGAAK